MSITATTNRKERLLQEIGDLVAKYPVAGVVSLEGISSSVMQKIRAALRNQATEIRIAKNTIKRLALEKAVKDKKGIKVLISHLDGSCGLIFTEMNPFRLQKILLENQMPAPAKAGQTSLVNVTVPAGITSMEPGPIIGQLNALGLPTRIEKGKIRITKSTEVLKAGETVTQAHADVLNRLGILPFKAGLSLSVAFEAGELIEGSALAIDEERLFQQLTQGYQGALALALEITFPTLDTIQLLLQRASTSARNLALEANILTPVTAKTILGKAFHQGRALAGVIAKKDSSFAP
ncbi:MAG: 50S ribosomal protein L10 [Candidatus Heimdallarchaeota archaeon]